MKPRELIKQLEAQGWIVDRVHGSHHILKKGNETVSIPVHNSDMKPGLLNNILKKTGLK
jgi:predicted RNA binding protein YcfA (HicA-like mRNA interferase family)